MQCFIDDDRSENVLNVLFRREVMEHLSGFAPRHCIDLTDLHIETFSFHPNIRFAKLITTHIMLLCFGHDYSSQPVLHSQPYSAKHS